MRNLFLIAITFISVQLFAQSFCGTNPSPEFLEYYMNKDMSYLNESGSRDANAIVYVPIQYHIIGTDAGTGYYPIKDLLAVHCLMNQRFSRSQIQFYLYAAPHYIKNTRYFNMSDGNVDRDMKNGNNIADVCNVYIVQNAVSSGVTVCGYATFPGFGRQGIVVQKSCMDATSSTLTHEMGHFLGLPHTFSGWEGRDATAAATSTDERVNGSNCATRGDRFCDTPADFISDRWNCPYTGAKTDFNGDLYRTVLDGQFFMSYSNDGCQTKFSIDQEAEMVEVRNISRSGMNRYTVPSVLNPASTNLVSPTNASINVAPFTSLVWNKSADATHYHVMMSTSSSFAFNVLIDTITADTSFLLRGANTATTYYWKVLPMTLGATCGTYTPTRSFTTSALSASLVITNITCPGGNDGAINISPSGGSAPYTFTWSTGDGFNPITDLVANTYSLTITDLLGRTMFATIVLPDGPSININIFPTSVNQITAEATGGNGGPYTYTWSNGVNTQQNSPNIGNVTVTVTDQFGCSTSKTILYNSIDNTSSNEDIIKIYPNPNSSNANTYLNIATDKSSTAFIKVYSMTGEEVINTNASISEGENTIKLSTANLSSGVYMINIQYNNTNKNIRLVIQ